MVSNYAYLFACVRPASHAAESSERSYLHVP